MLRVSTPLHAQKTRSPRGELMDPSPNDKRPTAIAKSMGMAGPEKSSHRAIPGGRSQLEYAAPWKPRSYAVVSLENDLQLANTDGSAFEKGPASAQILTRSAFGSYIGFSDASAAKRSPAISTS